MITTHTPAWPGSSLLLSPWRRLSEAMARFLRDQEDRRGLELLDGHALRDLGLHRSELGSFLAEASGVAEPTRTRIRAGTAPLGG